MKITLLNSCFISQRADYIESTEPCLRAGVASIAAFLRENGVDVWVVDPQAERLNLAQTVDRILFPHPDIVGLPAYTEEIDDAALIAEWLKGREPNIVTAVGGPHASALPAETLRQYPWLDVCVVGEGEETLLELASGKELEMISGIAHRREDGGVQVNPARKNFALIDRLPYPAWDLYDLERYPRRLYVEVLRGCPSACNFCFRVLGRRVRYRSAQRVVDEIEHDMKAYKISSFSLLAGTFPLDKTHAMQIFDEIISRNLRIEWRSSPRVDTIDEDLLRRMKQAGCSSLQIGVESGDDQILQLIGKKTKVEDIEKTFKLCKEYGIRAGANFMLGLPHETKKSIAATRSLAQRLGKWSSHADFAILTPFPGTEIYHMAVHNVAGLKLVTRDWKRYGKQSGLALEHQNFPGKALARYQARLYFSYYLRRNPLTWRHLFSWKRAIQLLTRLFGIRY